MFCIYLISPILLKVLKRHIKTVKTGLFGILLSIMCSFSLAALFSSIESITDFNDLCYGSPYRRVFYVLTGMLIAQIYNMLANDTKKQILPIFILSGAFENSAIILSIFWFLLRESLSAYLGVCVYIFDMAIVSCDLFALAIGTGMFSKYLSNKQLIYLGDISMYIFLSHYVFRNYINFAIKMLHLSSLPMALLEIFIILLLTMITSIQLHRYFSKTNLSS